MAFTEGGRLFHHICSVAITCKCGSRTPMSEKFDDRAKTTMHNETES